MAACEKCWADAFGRVRDHPMKSQTEHYQDLLEERKFNPCTPEQQKGETMDKGVPDCPDCGGKGMCSKHKLEYLKWVAETAQQAYMNELKTQSRKGKNVSKRSNCSDNASKFHRPMG